MKFAYLIMAHDNQSQLAILLKLLNQPENEIFLHIDLKWKNVNVECLRDVVDKAVLHIYRKFRVEWAGISQTKCQIFLLNEAVKKYHDYYHLISGHDLPIKKHKDIIEFFEKNKGKEFVHFESKEFCSKDACKYYHFWGQFYRRGREITGFFCYLEKISLCIQKKMNIFRKYYCGANWYSITHGLAVDFCEHKKKMLRMVRWTKSSDEYILQTFIKLVSAQKYNFYSSTISPDNYMSIARLIDWKRGHPYVWGKSDYEEIITSDRMFARKFDEEKDFEIIKMIEQSVQ